MAKNHPGVVYGRRVAVVGGLRTPFVKSGTGFRNLSTLDLGAAVTNELLQRTNLDAAQVDQLVFGAVVADVGAPNIAREVVMRCNMPASVDAYSVSRACATSTQAIVSATQAILYGEADIAIAGGSDTLSKPPIMYDDKVVDALMAANAAKDLPSKVKAFTRLRPGDLAPRPPALADLSSGLTMGAAAEKMARENGISREAQDEYAYESHMKAVAAWEKGVFDDEVMPLPIPPKYKETVSQDGIPRADSTLEKLAKLKPAFDRKYGSVTAGNSSPLTDGAAAVLLMEEKTAKRLGFEPKAFIKSWAFAGLDPAWQMLMGPSFATPIALEQGGLTLDDIDVIDMHEAFSAQMLSNLQAFKSTKWAKKYLNKDEPIGEIPADKLNLYGGSISLGHPFAATGARQALTMANELQRRDKGTALVTQCAAGGLGAALILER
ncbi:MAG: acetyl-CoA C-acyltransferase FadI [Acidimicrobiia bacterium]|nr:acetyl-CoA C-acyltransferase FadI [Acidimicrobiia bacterium]